MEMRKGKYQAKAGVGVVIPAEGRQGDRTLPGPCCG